MLFCWAALALVGGVVRAGTVGVFTSRLEFEIGMGQTTIEDFTIPGGQAALLVGPLNSASDFPADFGFASVGPGEIVPGVSFSSPGATEPFVSPDGAKFFIDSGGLAGFQGSFLATYNRSGPPQPLTATFASPVSGVGFDTDHVYTGDTFTATLHLTSGADVVEPLTNSFPDGTETFYGFTAPGPDIASITLLGSSASDNGFGLDNFTFAKASSVPLPSALYMSLALLPGLTLLARKVRSGT
jgi:hypothetical protein